MAKGVISKPMPTYWYSMRDNKIDESDSDEVIKEKEFNTRIVASRKPYFMIYIYPKLKAEYEAHKTPSKRKVRRLYDEKGIEDVDSLINFKGKTESMRENAKFYDLKNPVGTNPCVVNKMATFFEDEFDKYISNELSVVNENRTFDYNILRSNVVYSRNSYKNVEVIYKDYINNIAKLQESSKTEKIDKNEMSMRRKVYMDLCMAEFSKACSNKDELCNILLDLCYKNNENRQLVWDICGDIIIDNLLKRNKGVIHYPELVTENGDFEYCGKQFKMIEKELV